MNIIYPFCNGVSNNFAAGNELNDSITLSDLAEEKVWIAWKEQPNKQGKLTKIPKDPATGDNAKVPSDPTTYGTLDDAIKCRKTMNGKGGVGVVLGAIGNGRHLVGIDLDSCREPKSETITDWAEEVIGRFDTYAEVSPSQRGIKLFFLLGSTDLKRLHALLGQTHKGEQLTRKTFAAGEHREVAIDTARFYAVTGNRLQDNPESLRTVSFSDVSWFIQEAGPNYLARHHKANGQQQTNGGICRGAATLSGSCGNVTAKACPKPKRWRHC
jgi:putative DNA primase/helicase